MTTPLLVQDGNGTLYYLSNIRGNGTLADPWVRGGGVADGDDATQGITTGSAITTDAAGTNHDYLRGLVVMHTSGGSGYLTLRGTSNANTPPSASQVSATVSLSPNSGLPSVIQRANGTTSSGGKTLQVAFGSNNTLGNTLLAVVGTGNYTASNWAIAVTDSAGNSWTQDAGIANGNAQYAAVFRAPNCLAAANNVTLTISGTSSGNTALAMQLYEISGLLSPASALDASATSASSGTSVTLAATATSPNDLAVCGIAAGNATLTASSPWVADSSLTPTGGNLVRFGSLSYPLGVAGITQNPAATLGSSVNFAAAVVVYRTPMLSVNGVVSATVTNTVAVSGTVTAIASGTYNVQGLAANNAAVSGNPVLMAGTYNSSAPTFASGTAATLQADVNGNLMVNVAAGGTSGTVTQNSTTRGESGMLVQGAVTTAAPSYTTAKTSPLSLTTGGLLRVDASGATVTVAGSGTFTVSGTVTANIGTSGSLALDTSVNGILLGQNSTTSGQTGPIVQGAVTTSAPSYTTAKTSPLSLTTGGLLRVDASGTTVTVAGSGTFTVSGTVTASNTAGDVASGSSDSGNPVKTGGIGKTANPTAVSDGQRVNALHDKLGKRVVVEAIRDLKGQQKTTITSSTSETTIVTAVASTFLDLYGLIIANTSATACNVTIKDSTSGTTRFIIAVPAGETRGFMVGASSAVPQATVNTNWTATCSASVASIEITALYVKNT